MNTNEILNGLSAEQQDELLKQLTAKKQQKDLDKRKAYEDIRENFAKSVKDKVVEISLRVKDFRDWLDKESEGFKADGGVWQASQQGAARLHHRGG